MDILSLGSFVSRNARPLFIVGLTRFAQVWFYSVFVFDRSSLCEIRITSSGRGILPIAVDGGESARRRERVIVRTSDETEGLAAGRASSWILCVHIQTRFRRGGVDSRMDIGVSLII